MIDTPRLKTKLLSIFLILLSAFILNACSSSDKNSDDPSVLFKEAESFEKDERFEEAIKRFSEIKNKFPYSNYATRAELAVADCYYKQESFGEAQVSYQTFRELHPKHQRIDYVIFKVGMSYFKQLPDSIDRDLTVATDAITNFDDLIKNYPQSENLKEARESREKALHMLAEKERYIAHFYYIRKKYEAALGRYENLYIKYADIDYEAEALSRAAICAFKTDQTQKQQKYLTLLEQLYPQSAELADAKKEIK